MAESVTDARYISRKTLQKRNADEPGPDACFYCSAAFQPDQMRYPIRNFGGVRSWFEPDFVSVCMDCFKQADDDVTSKQTRYERKCQGCDAPILTPTDGVFAYGVCSKRCYQRAYRKRRRKGGGSTVSWKGSGQPICQTCKHSFVPSRKDACYCSDACRQRAYRGRLARSSSQQA